MSTKGCIAMLLAGGRGERLGSLTRYYAKPAVYFGGNNRIIDFALNNCKRSGIPTIGILSQYMAADLHTYVNLTHVRSSGHTGIDMLPSQNDKGSYTGTADAVYKNIGYIDGHNPEHILILAGDHIYNMDYGEMLAFHRKTGADVTVSSSPVSLREASRFGIINAEDNGRIYGFEEKPYWPKSNLASMGIYIFKWSVLKKLLFADSGETASQHDFGKNILPQMLNAGALMYTYEFEGYWRDVGTVNSLWEAHMDQLDDPAAAKIEACGREGSNMKRTPFFLSCGASVHRSIVSARCSIFGGIKHSVLGDSVTTGRGSEIVNSVVMPNAYIGDNVKIHNAIIGPRTVIMDNTVIGENSGTDFFVDNRVCVNGISLIAPWMYIPENMRFQNSSHIYKERMDEWEQRMNARADLNRIGSRLSASRLRIASLV